MKNSQLLQNLRQLGPAEWRRFLAFLASPYHNRQDVQLQLAGHLHDCLQKSDSAHLDRHQLHTFLYGEAPFRLQPLKDQFSALQKHLRHFLALEHLRAMPVREKLYTAREALARRMSPLWRQQLRSLRDALDQPAALPENPRLLRYQLLESEKEHLLRQRDRRSASHLLRRQMNTLDEFYWKERLRLSAEWTSLDQVLQQKEDAAPLPADLLDVVQRLPHLRDLASIQLYTAIIAMLSHPFPQSEPYFLQLTDGLQQGRPVDCPPAEVRSLYLFALNYCTARINSGNTRYYEHLFALYEQLVARQLLLHEDSLSQWTFINIVATGCHLRRFEWTLTFIQDHYHYLPADQQLNALNYNLALLFFYQQAYDQALEYLPQVQYTDPYYALNSRVLQIRIFFEKREWLLLESLLESLRIYLLREKAIPAKRKKEVNQLIRFTRQLAAIRESTAPAPQRRERLAALRRAIEAAPVVMHRDWLLRAC